VNVEAVRMLRGAIGCMAAFAVAMLYGWLKTLYYFQTFGVDLGLVEPSAGALLLDSWFVIQNVTLFALLSWVALKTRERWVIAIGLAYGMIPILSHYAFEFETVPGAGALIDYRHTILKVVPFVVIAILWFAQKRHRKTLTDPAWPYTRPALVVYVGVILFWGISAAKHFGAYDANRALRRPDLHLSRISIPVKDLTRIGFADVNPESLYLLAAPNRGLILWDLSANPSAEDGTIRTFVVPREDVSSFEIRRAAQVQPGSQYF